MVRRALILLCFGFMTVFMASCGQTYELQSITVTPAQPNIEGINTSQALTVMAHYSNTKSEDVTVKSTYQIGQATALSDPDTPLGAVSVSKSGIVETSATVPACTWDYALNSDGKTYSYWITSPYVVTITYAGFTTTSSVSVDSLAGCYDGIGYKAPTPSS
jgi:hypothetical protein